MSQDIICTLAFYQLQVDKKKYKLPWGDEIQLPFQTADKIQNVSSNLLPVVVSIYMYFINFQFIKSSPKEEYMHVVH